MVDGFEPRKRDGAGRHSRSNPSGDHVASSSSSGHAGRADSGCAKDDGDVGQGGLRNGADHGSDRFAEAEKRSRSRILRANDRKHSSSRREVRVDRSDSSTRVRIDRKTSRLTIADVSAEDLQLVSEVLQHASAEAIEIDDFPQVSLECIDCVESLMRKAKAIHAPYDLRSIVRASLI